LEKRKEDEENEPGRAKFQSQYLGDHRNEVHDRKLSLTGIRANKGKMSSLLLSKKKQKTMGKGGKKRLVIHG